LIYISLTGNRVLRLPCECASTYLKHRIHIFTFKQWLFCSFNSIILWKS